MKPTHDGSEEVVGKPSAVSGTLKSLVMTLSTRTPAAHVNNGFPSRFSVICIVLDRDRGNRGKVM